MDGPQFRKAVHAATEEIINYFATVQDRRVVSNVLPGYLRKLLPDGPPKSGEKWEDIQKDIESKIMPGMTHWQSPNFFAFFPSPCTYPSMLGELYSAALTAPAFNWICSPAVTELETIVLDWLANLLHLPPCYLSSSDGGGVIQASASEAVVTVMVVARDRYLRESTRHLEGTEREDAIAQRRAKLVALGSEACHSCTQKAAMIVGTRYLSVPTKPEDGFSMRGKNLSQQLLGTTSTCAVDRFDEIAEVLEDYPSMWVHVDAAFAGAALVCEEYQHLTQNFTAFDSFDMNMSKWLLTNVDASCMFVKRRQDLIDTLSISPSYLRNRHSAAGDVTDYRDWQFGLSRRFRALKIWFVMRTYGVDGFQAHIRAHIKLGELFHSLVASRPDLFQIVGTPAFALTTFAVTPRHRSLAIRPVRKYRVAKVKPTKASSRMVTNANKLTETVYETIISRGKIYLTSTLVGSTYAMRVLCAHPKIEEKYMRKAFDILVETAEEILYKG